jgi:branched-chain amino acid transport system permease protein
MNTQTITNGSMGIKGIPRELNIFYYILAAVVVVIILSMLLSSSFGRAFKAMREDDIVAEAVGIGLFKHKLQAFVVSGFFAGFGGALFAAHLGTVDPSTFKFMLTFDFLLIIVLGGLGSISGTVISAFIVTIAKDLLRALDEPVALFGVNIPLFRPGFRMVIFSLLLMIVVIFWQKGLMGKTELSWNRIFGWFKGMSKKEIFLRIFKIFIRILVKGGPAK